MSATPTVLAVIGNPRLESRTHRIARTLAAELRRALDVPATDLDEVDLAPLGARVLDYGDSAVAHEVERVLAADVLIVASPTYKATYAGLLKAFLDRVGGRRSGASSRGPSRQVSSQRSPRGSAGSGTRRRTPRTRGADAAREGRSALQRLDRRDPAVEIPPLDHPFFTGRIVAPGGFSSPTYCDTGIPTVMAAGNDGSTNAVLFPACISSAITARHARRISLRTTKRPASTGYLASLQTTADAHRRRQVHGEVPGIHRSGIPHLTAVGSDTNMCQLSTWAITSIAVACRPSFWSSDVVLVRCTNAAGTPMDARFTVTYSSTTA